MAPKGIRRNNPFNLMRTEPRQGWDGAVADDAIDADREEMFTAAFYGLRAGGLVLLNDELRHGLWTMREIFTRWAPPVENDTASYVAAMADGMGVGPDERIDLRDAARLARLMKLATRQENGEQPYDDALIDQAAQAAVDVITKG